MTIGKVPLREQLEFYADNYTGKTFLRDLAYYLAEVTNVKYVLIGYPEKQDLSTIKAAALYANGKMVENYSYPLIGTPCENVIGRHACYYPSNIQDMFPEDKELKELNIHSYIGVPLFSEQIKPVGIFALMNDELISNPKELEDALRVLAPKVARELKLFCNF